MQSKVLQVLRLGLFSSSLMHLSVLLPVWACPPTSQAMAPLKVAAMANQVEWPRHTLPGGFTLQLPRGAKEVSSSGKDSLTRRFVHADLTLEMDLSPYADPLANPSAMARDMDIHGLRVRWVTFQRPAPKGAAAMVEVLGLHLTNVPGAEATPGMGPLKLTLQCLPSSVDGRTACEQVLRSLRHQPTSDVHSKRPGT